MAERKRGKRIEWLDVPGPVRRHRVELRWDKEADHFFAELGGKVHKAATAGEVERELKKTAKELDALVWRWWISYEYEAHGIKRVGSGLYHYNHDRLQPEDVAGLELQFAVIALTDPIDDGGKPRQLYRRVEADDDGELVENVKDPGQHYYRGAAFDHLVEYTPERFASFVKIRKAMQQLHQRMGELFDKKEIGKRLDALAGRAPLGLPAPSEEP